MKAKSFLRILLILSLLSVNIGCDQVSKSVARKKLNYHDQISFFDHHFNLIKVENTGAFLSVGNSLTGPARFILLNLLPLIAVVAGLIFILTRKSLNNITLLSVIMIVGGGAGNLYDRMVHGSVTDFLHINFGIFQTGIFNIADVSIMVGMAILLVYAFVQKPDVEEDIKKSSQFDQGKE